MESEKVIKRLIFISAGILFCFLYAFVQGKSRKGESSSLKIINKKLYLNDDIKSGKEDFNRARFYGVFEKRN